MLFLYCYLCYSLWHLRQALEIQNDIRKEPCGRWMIILLMVMTCIIGCVDSIRQSIISFRMCLFLPWFDFFVMDFDLSFSVGDKFFCLDKFFCTEAIQLVIGLG